MGKLAGVAIALVIGALLGFGTAAALVATQKPDAKAENTSVSEDVAQAGNDPAKVVLRYGNR